jgi:hypothetical protein
LLVGQVLLVLGVVDLSTFPLEDTLKKIIDLVSGNAISQLLAAKLFVDVITTFSRKRGPSVDTDPTSGYSPVMQIYGLVSTYCRNAFEPGHAMFQFIYQRASFHGATKYPDCLKKKLISS